MTAATRPQPTDRRPEIVAQFVELIHSHYRGRDSQAATASQELQKLGLTVHLEPRAVEART